MSDVQAALEVLYRAPLTEFVAERKRLAAELKAKGDLEGAARITKLARPPVSVWAVNQLWWHERAAFEALIEAAQLVKSGERDASKQHREALNSLKQKAASVLQSAGNAASEPTLRRVTTTLSALAATGGFAPDPAGALGADRDPPGFEALGDFASTPRHDEAEQQRQAAAAQARRQAERDELSRARRDAQELLATQQQSATRLARELEQAEQAVKETRTLLGQIDERLASL
jgi:DNA repair exonuclease SbcCD ATPase subunit